jgi:membrane fusion protein (multidrug efflux system)
MCAPGRRHHPRRLFKEGSDVKAGQALYLIDPRSYRAARDQIVAQIESAKATLASAQAKADRYRTLTQNQAVSKQDIDDAIAAAGTAAPRCTSMRPICARRN